MKLKPYQTDTLAVLRRFFEEARVAGPKSAYEAITKEPEQAKRLGRYARRLYGARSLPGAPYVCLRLPTGGGKTILAAHAIGIARDAWIEKDYPVVLWLVPSNTIRLQTVEALKNTRHPYRQALDEAFEGRVRVFDIADFTMIRPHDIRDNACVVVGTIQTLRVNNTEGRKVYAHNENMEPHFSAVRRRRRPVWSSDEGGKGRIKFSFANLLHIHRPLMIVDEAHNAVTGLTRDMQARVNPCAIIEFTATPRFNSNILHSVSAQELKARRDDQAADHPGRARRSGRTRSTARSQPRGAGEKTRKGELITSGPIVLFQAQPQESGGHGRGAEEAPDRGRADTGGTIAVATGDQRELDGIDLFDPKCPIEYVITVEALKEGWDCSFAYVFCSVHASRARPTSSSFSAACCACPMRSAAYWPN